MRRAIIAICCIASLTIGTEASAHVKRYGGTITAYGGNVIDGTVSSSRSKCFAFRALQLFKQDGTFAQNGSTDGTGYYLFTFAGAPCVDNGWYYVVAPKRVFNKRNGHRHICKSLVSANVQVYTN